jgi:hypothetical protein
MLTGKPRASCGAARAGLGSVILLALAVARPAVSQTASDMQKVLDRLDHLEAENRTLLDEIHALRSELEGARALQTTAAPSTPPAPSAPLPAPSAEERLDVQESRTAELAQTKVEASQKFPVSLTGMLLFNSFLNGKYGGGAQYPVTASQTAASASGATLRQTVLGLKFNGPDLPWGGKASGSLYMDFFAGSLSPGNNLLHIRVATLDLTWRNTTITLGQDKPVISPREPMSLAQVGVSPLTAAGNLWAWQPQARVEQRFSFGEDTGLRAQAGIYQTSENYSSALPQEYAATLARARPGYEGRFEFFHGNDRKRIEIAPGFHISNTHVAGMSVPSRIFSFDWLLKPAPLFEFSGAFFAGQDVAGLGALQGFTILPSGIAIPVHSHGEWGQLALFPSSRLSVHVYAGDQWNNSADLGSGSVTSNFVYAGNLIYKLAPNVLAAIEASQVRTQYLNSMLRLNNHYDLALAYLF